MSQHKLIMDPESSPAAKAKRLKRLRKLTTLERHDVAKKYGINSSTLKGWENARANGLSEKGAKAFIKIGEVEGVICTFEWLMHGIGCGPRLVEKLEKTTQKEISVSTIKTQDEKQIIQELQFFRRHYPNSLDYIVNDDGMEPHFTQGDYIAGIKYQGSNLKEILERNCIIQTKDGRFLFRKLRAGNKPGLYTLTCINPHTKVSEPIIYNIEILVASPVIWHRAQE